MSTLVEQALEAHRTAQEAAREARAAYEAQQTKEQADSLRRALQDATWLPRTGELVQRQGERPLYKVDDLFFGSSWGHGVFLVMPCPECGTMLSMENVSGLEELGKMLAEIETRAVMLFHLRHDCPVSAQQQALEAAPAPPTPEGALYEAVRGIVLHVLDQRAGAGY